MKLSSDSWVDGERIPSRFAAGQPDGQGGAVFAENLNPHLTWAEAPPGTRSFALVCHDGDVPSRADDVNQADREVPADLPRIDFFHWVLIDIPATHNRIDEGEFSRGFTAKGKAGPEISVPGFESARHGLNDYTGWFASSPDMAGNYFGYDGPFPPFNDSLIHRYVFTLYALSAERLSLTGVFTGAQMREVLKGLVLAEATYSGTYTLNRRLLG